MTERKLLSAGVLLALLLMSACADEPVAPPEGFPQQQSQKDRTTTNYRGPADPAPPGGPLQNTVIAPPPALF